MYPLSILPLLLCIIFHITDVYSYWIPKIGLSWQWQILGTLDTTIPVQMYDIDLFLTNATTTQNLHQQGKIVTCYFSAGT